ncbi:low-temperature-induced 65 kDa protein-like [Pyrus ussuriensis x Pyrus communis]|uniref:Low-temperature-induced 65 kDa protein-like n=1 Tax=Pyrus ussuriensis x Pyrus communis TaxID=2448454 RepID=A0A5N5F679_9ROSA|nr:low-temperature-induced 65 kDa protein-like [Pyrus ussuriensis x Pyrus communis]
MESQHVGTHQGEEEDHQEKSVFKMVRDKAKKIKNKLTKHGQGHEHDLDEEDGEEKGEDLGAHGATTTGSRASGQGDIPKVPMEKFGDTKGASKHDDDPKVPLLEKTDPMKVCAPAAGQRTRQTHSVQPGVTPMHDEVLEPRPNYHASTTESLVGHDQIPSQQPKVDFGKTSVTGEAPNAPQNTPLPTLGEYKSKGADPSQTFISGKEGYLGQSKEHTPVSSLGGDDQKTNVADTRQTSVTGKEGHSGQTRVPLHHRGLDDRAPISSRGDYQKTNVTDPSHTSATGNEGHLGQSEVNLDRPRGLEEDPNAHMADPQAFTPSNVQTKVTDPTNAGGDEFGITQIHRSFDKMSIHAGDTKPSNQGSSYTEKASSAASAIAGKATSAKNAVASTLGYGGGNNDQREDVNPYASSPENDSTKSGLHRDVGTNQNLGTGSHDQFSPEHPPNQGGSYAVADKAISAKNAVASKLGYGGGNNDQHEFVKPQASSYQTTGTGQNLSTPENPSNQGSYAGKISSATNAIVDTAISAKNVVASKLGYGGDIDQQQHGDHAAVGSGSAAPEQQGKGITAAVTEKPTPVSEKVAGAGSTLMSKLPGSTGTAGKEEVHQGTATTRGEYDKAGKDKGVSVKGYLSEKLKPGEEDRAPSEVVSETLHERKAEQPRSGARPVGKVTETEAVTRQLGPDYGAEDVQQSGYGKVVADTLKGAVGSLFGKADQTTASPESRGSSTGTEGFSSSGSVVAEQRGRGGVEKRRLDESGK